MDKQVLNEQGVHNKLASIIGQIAKVNVTDTESSLLGPSYCLSPELVVYILLEASKEFGFDIHDEFVISLGDYSYQNLAGAILMKLK